MSEFYRRFLAEDVRKMGAPSGRQVFLAAFGKHPGWDDHVEDLGLETESLVYAKSRLYVQGIGGQIDSGAWEKLDDSQRLPVFKHVLMWQRGNQLILGRMWASSDGKGRTRYPLIVCAHCAGLPLEWALDQILPRLEDIERACAATSSAADVRSLLERHRSELRSAAAQTGTSTLAVSSSALADFMNHPALGPEKEGWFRILHQMQSQMALFAPGRFSLKGDLASLRSQQVRVPGSGSSLVHNLLLWSRFFQTQVDSAVPLLFTVPLDGNWLDVTAGEITPAEVFALRASPKAVPLASEVPYNLEPAFREKARAQLAAFAGDTAMKARPASSGAGDGPVVPPASGGKLKLLRWLGGGGAVVIVGVLALALTFGNRGKEKQVAAAPPATPTPGSAASLVAPGKEEQPSPAQADQAATEQQLAMARQDEERRLAQAAEAERRRQVEAAAKIKADEEARQRMIAAEAERRRLAEEEARMRANADAKAKADAVAAKARADLEARAKAESEAKARAEAEAKANIESPKAVASVVPPSVPDNKPASPAVTRAREMTNSVGIVLVLLPGDVWVGKYEVTQGEYMKVMGSNPSKITGNPRLPVESLTWEDAGKFCEKLTELERAAGTLPAGFTYSLPTLAQWDLMLGDATFDQAVTSRSGVRNATALVGTLPANKHGLHDVLGNVWEWCLDGPGGIEKGLRGGAFNNLKTFRFKPLNPETAHKLGPRDKSHDAGFRCVLVKSQ